MSRKRDRLKRQARVQDHKEFKKWLAWYTEEMKPENIKKWHEQRRAQLEFIENHLTVLRAKYKSLTISRSEGF